jgi:hypothetical protein
VLEKSRMLVRETGVEASAKSRAVAALDRLLGNAVDAVNIPLEARNARLRSVQAGEKKIIEAAAEHIVKRMDSDPEFTQRAIDGHFDGIFRKQANKDAVAFEAVEQLKLAPPSAEQSSSGPPKLDDDFMVRLENFAEGATSEQLRSKWARVLAAEVRKPGTFSPKAMRVVDELSAETAMLFESICRFRLDDVLPLILVENQLGFGQIAALTTADLLLDPGVSGQLRLFSLVNHDGVDLWFCHLGKLGIAIPQSAQATRPTLQTKNGRPGLPVYILTEVGEAIATILEDHQEQAFAKLVNDFHQREPKIELRLYRRRTAEGTGDTAEWLLENVLPAEA